MQPETFYRYEDPYLTEDLNFPLESVYGNLREFRFSLVAETPKGYWIGTAKAGAFSSYGYLAKPKWVSATSRIWLGYDQRYAYPTKELALESYMMRKKRQILILTRQLERAKAGLSKAQTLL